MSEIVWLITEEDRSSLMEARNLLDKGSRFTFLILAAGTVPQPRMSLSLSGDKADRCNVALEVYSLKQQISSQKAE